MPDNAWIETLQLRNTAIAHLPFVLAAERHPDNAPYVGQWSEQRHREAIASENEAHFIVERVVVERNEQTAKEIAERTSQAVGYMICQGLQNEHKALLLCRIVITQKRRGYGRQALTLIKDYAFDTLGFHRLWFDVIASNKRARALYKSAGFKVEGHLRDAWKTPAGYEDMMLLSMLATEYSPSTLETVI